MSSTEQRTGFRLSWGGSSATPPTDEFAAPDLPTPEADAVSALDAAQPAVVEPAPRPPTRFMADLVRAMRAAAEESRSATLEALRAESRTFMESVHARSADEATELRRVADDDIAAIRDWSKAEIARVRAETDERIAARKVALEGALGDHAALVELEIEGIGAAVATYEAEMDAFFTRLSGIDEPGAFAAAAATAPEPPSLEQVGASARAAARTGLDDHRDAVTPAEPTPSADPETTAPAEPSWPAADALGDQVEATEDPRLAALALATAESEAAVDAASESSEPLEEVSEDSLNARLAHLVPEASEENGTSASVEAAPDPEPQAEPSASTRVVVVGLVNVASIASFKRHLARVRGVATVVVSSGPDGEFVFTASHVPDVALRDVIPTLPGFAARVTGMSDGVLTVSARDPEQDA